MSKKRQLRVVRRDKGSSREWGQVQLLQEKRWWGWKTIDREEIPSHVSISLATVGDTGGWMSKFAEIGSFGPDGIIQS